MKAIALILSIAITGCATTDDSAYYKAQAEVEVAKYNALSAIAANGNDSAKVAAVMSMALGGQSGGIRQAPQTNNALAWASVLVPGLTNIAGIAANVRLGMTQSDNSTRLGMSTNEAFVGIAGKIQAPGAITTTTTTDNHTTNPSTPTRVCGATATTLNCQ